MNQKGLVFNYILNTAVRTYLTAGKHTSGLDNPEEKVGTATPVYLSYNTHCVQQYCKPKLSRQSETRPYTLGKKQTKLAI